jgi:hypothetical protein
MDSLDALLKRALLDHCIIGLIQRQSAEGGL